MSEIGFCATCDRLFDNYNATIDRGDKRAADLALVAYDDYRDQAHGRGHVA